MTPAPISQKNPFLTKFSLTKSVEFASLIAEKTAEILLHPNSLKNLRLFQPGVSGNPRGTIKLPDELKAIKSLSQLEVTKLISKYARMNRDELIAAKNNPAIPVVDLTVISIFAKSIELGDFTRFAFLLDRCVGKVKDITEDEECRQEREQLEQLTLQQLYDLVKPNFETPEAG